MSDPVLWHDLECGRYVADLALWRELAATTGGPVLDVGAGSGRVALDLARAAYEVVALDADAVVLAALRERAGGLPVATVHADARDFALHRTFPLVLAPMQTIQLLGGAAGRARFLARAAAHLAPGGLVAAALVDALDAFDAEADDPLPLPDVVERDGWVHMSQPVRVGREDGGWVIERVRESVSPGGERHAERDRIRLDDVTPAGLEAEARAAGLVPHARTRIAETAEHVGAEVVVLARA